MEGLEIVDKSIIGQIQKGNTRQFEKIVEQYEDYIYSLCLGIVRDPHMAADISQETFIKIYTSIATYNHQGFKTWISRIATNTSIDYIRKRTKEQQRTISLDSYEEPILLQHDPDTPESLLLAKDQEEKILSTYEGLAPKYRNVMKKYYIDNKNYATIANEEKISVKAVESRLYRAKKMIKKQWEGEGYGRFS